MKSSILFLSLLMAFNAHAAMRWKVIEDKSKVEFTAVGKPGFIKINGTGATAEGDLKIEGGELKGEVLIDLQKFTTGIDLRDEHMKEKYLECTKKEFQKARLKNFRNIEKNKEWWNEKKVNMTADLEIKGQTQPVDVTIELTKTGKVISAQTDFTIKLKDYKIDVPSFAGVTVAEKIDIKANLSIEEVGI